MFLLYSVFTNDPPYLELHVLIISSLSDLWWQVWWLNWVNKLIIQNYFATILYKSKQKKINQSQLYKKKNTFQVLGQSISHPSVYIKPLNNWMIYEDWVKMYHQKCCNHIKIYYFVIENKLIDWFFFVVPSSPYILYKINYKIKLWNIYHKSLIIEAAKTPTKFPIQRFRVN